MSLARRVLISAAPAILLLGNALTNANGAEKVEEIQKVFLGPDKQVQILSYGKEIPAPKEKDQVSCSSPKLAEDGKTAGWLVEYDNCCTSYPLPLSLVVYRNGKVVQRWKPGQSIWDWQFLQKGKQVAFWTGPTHGNFVSHFELHDVNSGKLLADWTGRVNEPHPTWVSGLKD